LSDEYLDFTQGIDDVCDTTLVLRYSTCSFSSSVNEIITGSIFGGQVRRKRTLFSLQSYLQPVKITGKRACKVSEFAQNEFA